MIETNKREGIYSFIHTPLLTVAIHVFSAQHHNRTADPFSAHMVFLSFSTPPSSLLAADSDHKKDFYAHPLAAAIDENRNTAWWFRGNRAEVAFTFANPLCAFKSTLTRSGEFVNKYAIVSSAENPKTDPRRWELYGSNNNHDFVLLDARSDESFAYRLQRRTFSLNNAPKNYRYFKLQLCRNRPDF